MNITEIEKKLRVTGNMVLEYAASELETFVWIFNYVLRSVTLSLFDLRASNLDRWPTSMLSYDGVDLSIGSNLKLAPVSCAIPE